MRLRRGVLTFGLLFLSLASAPIAVFADDIEETRTPTVDVTAEVSPTMVPAAEQEMTSAHVAVWLCDDAKCPEPTAILAAVLVSAVDRQSDELLASA